VICSSGIGFDARIDGKRLIFGFEGIYQGTAVLYDQGTRSLWMHLTGRCFGGALEGQQLQPLPSGRHTTWEEWRRSHPQTTVMARERRFEGGDADTGYFAPSSSRSGSGYLPKGFGRTIEIKNGALPPSTLVYGIRIDGVARAYALDALRARGGVLEERVRDVEVTIWFDPVSRSVNAFNRTLGTRSLTFQSADGGRVRDTETQSLWNLDGACVSGTLRGAQLTRIEGLLAEWYGWFANHPTTELVKE
jgi:hypothetical protein